MGNFEESEADIDRPFDFLEDNRKNENTQVHIDHEEGRSVGRIIAWDSNMNIHIETKTGEELIRGSSIHRLKVVDNTLSDL